MTLHPKWVGASGLVCLLFPVILFGIVGCDTAKAPGSIERPFEPAAQKEAPKHEAEDNESADETARPDPKEKAAGVNLQRQPALQVAEQRLLGVHLPEGFSRLKSSISSGTAMLKASAKQIETFYQKLNYTMVTRMVPGNRVGFQIAVSDEALEAVPKEEKISLAKARIYLFPVGDGLWSVQVYLQNRTKPVSSRPDPMGYIDKPLELRGRRVSSPRRESNSAGSIGGRKRAKLNVNVRPKLQRWKRENPNRPLLD